MKRDWRQYLVLALSGLLTSAGNGFGQEVYNIPLIEQQGKQYSPQVVASDAARGYFVFWLNEISGVPELYAQFLTEEGYSLWGAEGRRLIPRDVPILDYAVAPDGKGGVFVAWAEKAPTGIGTSLFLGRLDAKGEPAWTEIVSIGQVGVHKLNLRCEYDLDQGVYVIWEQSINPLDVDIFAQHVDGTGRKYWPYGGMPVIQADNVQLLEDTEALPEGLVVAWQDRASVLLQILNFKTGKPVKTSPLRPSIISLTQSRPRLARRYSSSESSVFVVWEESTNIRAQRFSASGDRLWSAIGVDVIRATGTQNRHEILSETRGGLIVLWQDSRDSSTGIDLRAQRLDKNGNAQWTSTGVIVNKAAEVQAGQKLIADTNDGFVCLWEDNRAAELNLYGQRVNRSGRLKWASAGVPVSVQPGAQRQLQLASLGDKVLAVWEDLRQDEGDIFAQFIYFNGKLHNVLPYFTSEPMDTAYVGSYYEYVLQAEDVDRDLPLTFNPVVLPDWLEFDENSHTLSGMVVDISGAVSLVSVEVIDARGGVGTQTFEIRVVGANHPPKILSQPDTLALEDSLYVYQLVIEDPDSNDVHTLELIELPDWLGVEEQDFRLVGVPENKDVGLHKVSLLVKDQAGEAAQQEFTIRVLNTNDPPEFLTASAADTAIEDEEYSFEFQVLDPDVGDEVTLEFLIQPSWLHLDIENSALVGTPTNDHLGDTLAVIMARDLEGASDTLSLRLFVKNTNDPPFFVSVPDTEAVVDSLYEYAVVVDDVDPDDELRLFYRNGPSWLNLNPTHFVLSGIPPASAANDRFLVRLEVVDAAGASSEQEFFLYVREQAIPDSLPPPGPINPTITPDEWTAADSLTLRWITPADETGITRIFLKFVTPPQNNDDYEFSSAIRTAAGAVDSIRFPVLFEGDNKVYVWFADRQGNTDFKTAVPVRYRSDRSVPTPPQPIYPQEWSRGDTVRFAWLAARDSVSGIKGYFIALQQGNQVVHVPQFDPTADTIEVALPLHLSEKLVDWFVIVLDSAKNGTESTVKTFSVDNVMPLIIHKPVDTLQAGQPATFQARVTDIGSGVKSVHLLYRTPDQTQFFRQPMTTSDGINFTASLRGVDITAFGLEYAIVASDFADNRKFWKANDQISIYRSPVVLGASLPLPVVIQPMKYQMFGVPFYLVQNDPKAFFESQLGPYDDTRWRLLRYQNGDYVELTQGQIDSLMPGRAYWLITRESRQLQILDMATVRSDRPFRLTLQPGWNMIASPFNFTIRFDPASLPDGIEPVLWGYDGSQYRMETQKLAAWKGYFIKNNQATPVHWEIRPEKPGTAKQGEPWASALWYARLRVQQGQRADAENVFGQVAEPQLLLDWSDPPAIGETPRLYFVAAGPGANERSLASEFLPVDAAEPVWRMRVENLARGWVALHLDIGKSWPDSLALLLTDRTTGIERELQADQPVTFWNETPGGSRDFELRLLAKSDIERRRSLPTTLNLYPIRPNPFRINQSSHVTIRFSLVEPVRVRLTVYNLLGQEVWSTPELGYRAGEHAITWDGRTQSRLLVSSGIYFVHLEVVGQSQRLRQKIVLLH
ncbi:MAG: putative Ig domain-containing protein [candidate division KSB1 bacterium]|nr:putative Ig domain-containing protein [candidate division KSB1 bacterium]